jgi:hypothetical protein
MSVRVGKGVSSSVMFRVGFIMASNLAHAIACRVTPNFAAFSLDYATSCSVSDWLVR